MKHISEGRAIFGKYSPCFLPDRYFLHRKPGRGRDGRNVSLLFIDDVASVALNFALYF